MACLEAPAVSVPELPGWRERSVYIATEGSAHFYHYDFHAQALSKIERGHHRDLEDLRSMFRHRLVVPERLLVLLERVRGEFGRYPAVDYEALRERVEEAVREAGGGTRGEGEG